MRPRILTGLKPAVIYPRGQWWGPIHFLWHKQTLGLLMKEIFQIWTPYSKYRNNLETSYYCNLFENHCGTRQGDRHRKGKMEGQWGEWDVSERLIYTFKAKWFPEDNLIFGARWDWVWILTWPLINCDFGQVIWPLHNSVSNLANDNDNSTYLVGLL